MRIKRKATLREPRNPDIRLIQYNIKLNDEEDAVLSKALEYLRHLPIPVTRRGQLIRILAMEGARMIVKEQEARLAGKT